MNVPALRNPSDMSLKDLVQAIISTRIGLLITFVTALATYTALVFGLGESIQKSTTAIENARPFKMNLSVDQTEVRLDRVDLVLRQDELADSGQLMYDVHRFDPATGKVDTVGLIIADKPENKAFADFFRIAAVDLIASAQAQERFDWHGHESNFRFSEKFISKTKVRRTYDDGWVLEYDVDEKRNAIATSFRWVVTR
jgi:hypothetical protein